MYANQSSQLSRKVTARAFDISPQLLLADEMDALTLESFE
jgi:predicted ABC-type transport system involved in lysophospholipase L1 biosynthesis ATPase subunit